MSKPDPVEPSYAVMAPMGPDESLAAELSLDVPLPPFEAHPTKNKLTAKNEKIEKSLMIFTD